MEAIQKNEWKCFVHGNDTAQNIYILTGKTDETSEASWLKRESRGPNMAKELGVEMKMTHDLKILIIHMPTLLQYSGSTVYYWSGSCFDFDFQCKSRYILSFCYTWSHPRHHVVCLLYQVSDVQSKNYACYKSLNTVCCRWRSQDTIYSVLSSRCWLGLGS